MVPGNSHFGIFGQPPVEGTVGTSSVQHCGLNSLELAKVQLGPKPSEVSAGTDSSLGVSEAYSRESSRQSFSSPGETTESLLPDSDS